MHRPPATILSSSAALALCLLVVGCSTTSPPAPEPIPVASPTPPAPTKHPEPTSPPAADPSLPSFGSVLQISDGRLGEASGLAASNVRPGVLWALNDSGSPPQIFAIDTAGQIIELHTLQGAQNTDWESLDSFRHRGRPLLLIADVGDNNAHRSDCALYFVDERDPTTVLARSPLRFADGPRDCEGVVAAPGEDAIYAVAKRDPLSTVYRADLSAALAGEPVVAYPVGANPMPVPGAMSFGKLARHASFGQQITGLATRPGGGGTAWLTYTHAHVWGHPTPSPAGRGGESPHPRPYPELHQAEGIAAPAWDPGALWIISEGNPPRLVRVSADQEVP